MVYGVSTADPVTFSVVLLLLAISALLACLVPAYRATRVEPVTALRSE
jgi:putative ABC transport system permease protein